MPTIWDPNLSELAQACADAGHRPTDPADPGDVYCCAVAALAAQQAAQEARQVLKDRVQDIADRLRRWADELERPRARKAAVVAGMRLAADWLEQGAGEGDE